MTKEKERETRQFIGYTEHYPAPICQNCEYFSYYQRSSDFKYIIECSKYSIKIKKYASCQHFRLK